MNKQNLVEDHR